MKTRLKLLGVGVAGVVLAAALSAQATYLQVDSTALSTTTVGLNYPGGSDPVNYIYFGCYTVSTWANASGGPQEGISWLSVCLSPGGIISGREEVTKEDFGTATPGHLPASWSDGGIYNAAYLYNKNIGSVVNVNQSVGLALAVLDALYDSNGMGIMSGAGLGTGNFSASGYTTGTGSEKDYYDQYIAQVTTANINAGKYYMGAVWRPTNPNNGQDFIIGGGTEVPEPTTMIAGALLLLPFGASTLRILRKRAA